VHYWLVERTADDNSSHINNSADVNANDSPLVLWQQGGPGGSSVGIGYFNELGPFVLDNDSVRRNKSGVPQLVRNENSWTKYANILFLEHPAGTGFSYCKPSANHTASKDANNANSASTNSSASTHSDSANNDSANSDSANTTRCKWDDQTQSVAFHAALIEFYRLYPEFVQNGLWLAGESYAGTLIPSLVQQIMLHEGSEDSDSEDSDSEDSGDTGGAETGSDNGSDGGDGGSSNTTVINRNRSFPQLQAIAVGNGCIGTPGQNTSNRGWCQGPYSHRYHTDFFFGHGAVNRQLYSQVQ
jgi:hypothetical protein